MDRIMSSVPVLQYARHLWLLDLCIYLDAR